MQGTKKMGTRPTPSFYTSSVKQPTALLNFLYKFAEFIDLVSIRIHSTFIDWSPSSTLIRRPISQNCPAFVGLPLAQEIMPTDSHINASSGNLYAR
jgi:hypothetical protein